MKTSDKVLRILIVIIIAGLYFTNLISGTAANILLILVGVFILTSFMSFCPLYYPFGISTKKKKSNMDFQNAILIAIVGAFAGLLGGLRRSNHYYSFIGNAAGLFATNGARRSINNDGVSVDALVAFQ